MALLHLPLTTLVSTRSSTISERSRRGEGGAKHAPDLGQHNEDILGELGFGADDIEALKSKGVIYAESCQRRSR